MSEILHGLAGLPDAEGLTVEIGGLRRSTRREMGDARFDHRTRSEEVDSKQSEVRDASTTFRPRDLRDGMGHRVDPVRT